MGPPLVQIFGLVLTWGIWFWMATRNFSASANMIIAVGSTLAVIPIVFGGRRLLDRQPTVKRAIWVTTGVHYILAIFIGCAIIEATLLAQNWEGWAAPVPPWLGLSIMLVSGILLVVVVFNLALKGLGAPFAVALTRVVATDWMYAWTRNPMVLSGLAFLIGLGLWLQSSLFLIWLLAILSPAMLVFLKVYEERELEIRFGDAYLEYKTQTPMLLPSKPKTQKLTQNTGGKK